MIGGRHTLQSNDRRSPYSIESMPPMRPVNPVCVTSVMRACPLPMLRRVLCLTAIAACGVEAEPSVGVEIAAQGVINDGSCPTYDCGLNGPLIDGAYFPERHKP